MIGVFDSGFGGLTVHKALVDALPSCDFVYLGDNKNAPYGSRPPLEVLTLACAGVERLFAEGCTLAIVACNTASVVALRWMQQQWLQDRLKQDGIKRNVLGIVVPTVEAATGLAWEARMPGISFTRPGVQRVIGIFATQRTVESGVYPLEIGKRRADIRVVSQACPGLVDAIESGAAPEKTKALVAGFAAQFRAQLAGGASRPEISSGAQSARPDSIILGCTHYPLVADLFEKELPGIPLVSQPAATATALKAYVEKHPEYATGNSGKRVFLSTGYAPEALPLIEKFWGDKIAFDLV